MWNISSNLKIISEMYLSLRERRGAMESELGRIYEESAFDAMIDVYKQEYNSSKDLRKTKIQMELLKSLKHLISVKSKEFKYFSSDIPGELCIIIHNILTFRKPSKFYYRFVKNKLTDRLRHLRRTDECPATITEWTRKRVIRDPEKKGGYFAHRSDSVHLEKLGNFEMSSMIDEDFKTSSDSNLSTTEEIDKKIDFCKLEDMVEHKLSKKHKKLFLMKFRRNFKKKEIMSKMNLTSKDFDDIFNKVIGLIKKEYKFGDFQIQP